MTTDIERADFLRLSISALSREFGVTRETAAKRLTQAGVRPDGQRRDYPTYRLKDAALAILAPT